MKGKLLTLAILAMSSTILNVQAVKQSGQLQNTIAKLTSIQNQNCLEFIDSFRIDNFKQNKQQSLENSMKWCFESQSPKMSCKKIQQYFQSAYIKISLYLYIDDLKIAECFISMHQYLAFQSNIAVNPIQEQLKLLMFTNICENLTQSLQYRDDLINKMQYDMINALNYCQDSQRQFIYQTIEQFNNETNSTNYTTIQIQVNNNHQWWWDNKTVQSGSDICQNTVYHLRDQQEYGFVTNVALDLAIDSFYAQLYNKILNICSIDTTSYQVFKRQCSKKIVDSGIILLLQDDQTEQICNQMSADNSIINCEVGSWFIVQQYHSKVLKQQLQKYGNLMVTQYMETALNNIGNGINELITKLKSEYTQVTNVVNSDIPQVENNSFKPETISTNNTQTDSQALIQQLSIKLNQQQNLVTNTQKKTNTFLNNNYSYDEDDEDDDDSLNSVPLEIPV